MSNLRPEPASHLTTRIRHRHDGLALNVHFALTRPWTILFGPSGSGKSTILRSIAGLTRPDDCTVLYGPNETILASTRDRIWIPPHLRPIRSAAQTARLFPHHTVQQNIAYGLGRLSKPRNQPDARHVANEIFDEILGLFRLRTLVQRTPAHLSGGERQRVSVARAVLAAVTFDGPGKALLLLDEPFAGLDAALRDELATTLQSWLSRWSIPVLSVSHDLEECFLLDAEVIRIAEGEIMEQGPVQRVLAHERTRILDRLNEHN